MHTWHTHTFLSFLESRCLFLKFPLWILSKKTKRYDTFFPLSNLFAALRTYLGFRFAAGKLVLFTQVRKGKEGAPVHVTSFLRVFLSCSSSWSRFPCRQTGRASSLSELLLFWMSDWLAGWSDAFKGDCYRNSCASKMIVLLCLDRTEWNRKIKGWVEMKTCERSRLANVRMFFFNSGFNGFPVIVAEETFQRFFLLM